MPAFIVTVSRQGDQLYEHASGQPLKPIYPYDPKAFFLKAVDAQIEFLAGKSGKISAMTLHQDGMVMSGNGIAQP